MLKSDGFSLTLSFLPLDDVCAKINLIIFSQKEEIGAQYCCAYSLEFYLTDFFFFSTQDCKVHYLAALRPVRLMIQPIWCFEDAGFCFHGAPSPLRTCGQQDSPELSTGVLSHLLSWKESKPAAFDGAGEDNRNALCGSALVRRIWDARNELSHQKQSVKV